MMCLVVLVLLSGLALSGCGQGPLESVEGDPGAAVSWMSIRQGQSADFGVGVTNTGSGPVTVRAVELIGVPGLPRPRLLHAGLEHAAKVGGGERNWPPPDAGWFTPLVGARLRPGRNYLWMGVTGARPGKTYAVAGLRLTYRAGSSTHSVSAYSGGVFCVIRGRSRSCPEKVTDRTSRKVINYIESQG